MMPEFLEPTGPCAEAYEYDLPDSDRLGPDYSVEEVDETDSVNESEVQTNG